MKEEEVKRMRAEDDVYRVSYMNNSEDEIEKELNLFFDRGYTFVEAIPRTYGAYLVFMRSDLCEK